MRFSYYGVGPILKSISFFTVVKKTAFSKRQFLYIVDFNARLRVKS